MNKLSLILILADIIVGLDDLEIRFDFNYRQLKNNYSQRNLNQIKLNYKNPYVKNQHSYYNKTIPIYHRFSNIHQKIPNRKGIERRV